MFKNLARVRLSRRIAMTLLGAGAALSITTSAGAQPPSEPLKIGFVYVTPIGDAGWRSVCTGF